MIFIGSDHAGLELKESVKSYLTQQGLKYEDCGTYTSDSCDYAKIARIVGDEVVKNSKNTGLLFCGTGVGMSIAANKIKGVRAACCSDGYSVRMTREHNDANIMCLGSRVVGTGLAFELVGIFLNTKFCGEERHLRRIMQIAELENNQ